MQKSDMKNSEIYGKNSQNTRFYEILSVHSVLLLIVTTEKL